MTPSPPTIALTCASDAGYAPYATAMLCSALRCTPQARFRIYYLHAPDLDASARKLVQQSLAPYAARTELHFIEVPDALVEGLPLFKAMKPGAIRPVMWYRVFLPQLVPQEPRILYLDSDIVVVESLLPLWNLDLDGYALAAVTNPFWGREVQGWGRACGLQREADYFNSGVMLLNLDHWRAHDVTAQVVKHGLANADWTRFGDQDSLVVILHAQRLAIPPRWNAMRAVMLAPQSRGLFESAALRVAIQKPAIVHFEGSLKPWIDPREHPYGRLYMRYAKRLPWPVVSKPFSLLDIENFFIRHNWARLSHFTFRLRRKLAARKQG